MDESKPKKLEKFQSDFLKQMTPFEKLCIYNGAIQLLTSVAQLKESLQDEDLQDIVIYASAQLASKCNLLRSVDDIKNHKEEVDENSNDDNQLDQL